MIHADFCLNHGGFTLELNLTLPARGVTAIFGPSGSGKSSLLRCLAGLQRPQRGQLSVNGVTWQDDSQKVFLPPHQRPVGMVFQDAALFPHLNVEQNLAFATSRRRHQSDDLHERERLIELLGIAHLAKRATATLSGGEKQRVAIARALFSAPQLLLLDEPLASLDEKRKAELLPYLEKLQQELEIPVIYVSHSLQEVARLADHLVLLQDGSVTAAGPTAELFSRINLPYASEEGAFTLLNGVVQQHDEQDFLSRIGIGDNALWVRRVDRPIGAPIRLRVLARDVSIALREQHDSSILNVIQARIEVISEIPAGQVLIQLRLWDKTGLGGATLAARITARSARTLALRPGQTVFVQIKGVAPLE